MVSLDDVATRAGVSKSTASRVLNNRGYLSQKTIMKVQKAVQELNTYLKDLGGNVEYAGTYEPDENNDNKDNPEEWEGV